MSTLTIPSLQGTLAKPTRLMLQPNFAKEPFRPSRSIPEQSNCVNLIDNWIENNNCQCLTEVKRQQKGQFNLW